MAVSDVSPREAGWRRFLAELDWWVKRHGDAGVPQSAISRARAEDYPLGRRVKAYRVAYRRGALSAERVAALEARRGWTWDGFGARAGRAWQQNLDAVREHVRRHGGLEGLEAVDAPVARWLRDQRSADLTQQQQRELAGIPGAFADRRSRLAEFVAALRDWISAAPDGDAAAVRFSTVSDVGGAAYPLGRRTAYWRARYAAGRLTPDEIAALAAIPGWCWSSTAAGDSGLAVSG